MDELKGKPIPGKAPLFNRPNVEPKMSQTSDFIGTFTNEDKTKAVNLVLIEDVDDTAKKLSKDSLQSYADSIMNGGDDSRELMVGTVFNGDGAEDKARAEAKRIDEEYNPGPGASDEELLDAAENAVEGDMPEKKEPMKPMAPAPKMGENPNAKLGENFPRPSFGNFAKPAEKKPVAEDVGNEPMLNQLNRKV